MLVLLLDLNKLRKTAEANLIEKMVAKSMASQVETNYESAETSAIEQCALVVEELENTSANITNVVKGKFGSKVQEAITAESEKINELY